MRSFKLYKFTKVPTEHRDLAHLSALYPLPISYFIEIDISTFVTSISGDFTLQYLSRYLCC